MSALPKLNFPAHPAPCAAARWRRRGRDLGPRPGHLPRADTRGVGAPASDRLSGLALRGSAHAHRRGVCRAAQWAAPACRRRGRGRRCRGRCCWPNARLPVSAIGRQTLAQAVRYNSVLAARYLILTNGLTHYCCEWRDGTYGPLPAPSRPYGRLVRSGPAAHARPLPEGLFRGF